MTGTLLALGTLLLAADGGAKAIPNFAIKSVATREPVVALTFDACATGKQANGFDRPIWNTLTAERIPVTFYLSGRWVEKHPSAAKLIAAAPWVELGNHSYSHPRLTLLRKDRLRTQIRYTNRILEKKLGRQPLSLRPPAGAWDRQVVSAAREEDLPVVNWSVISGGVGGRVPPARMVRHVVGHAEPGAIIIFHVNRREPSTNRALPGIIAGLRDKGFRFVTVSGLLALPDATPEPARPSRFGQRKRAKHPAATQPGTQPPPQQAQRNSDHANPPT